MQMAHVILLQLGTNKESVGCKCATLARLQNGWKISKSEISRSVLTCKCATLAHFQNGQVEEIDQGANNNEIHEN